MGKTFFIYSKGKTTVSLCMSVSVEINRCVYGLKYMLKLYCTCVLITSILRPQLQPGQYVGRGKQQLDQGQGQGEQVRGPDGHQHRAAPRRGLLH